MTFRFEGRQVEARPGDTYASALYRAGQRIFSRSFKYHRPRGLLCMDGKCPNCLMNVDGVPNVRTCVTAARDGAEVRAQNAYPSLETDLLSAAQHFDWLMPAGWYYKTFTHPMVWRFVEPHIRRVAGLGEAGAAPDHRYEHAWMHTQTAVIGAGWAGLTAALEAAERGEEVVIADDQPEPGGQSRYRGEPAAGLIEKVRSTSSIRLLQGCTCFGLYEGNLLGLVRPAPHAGAAEQLIHLRARRVVIATGAYETPLLFPNNDLVGVMLSTAALRLMRMHGLAPGRRAAIAGEGARAAEVDGALREAGVAVAATVAPKDVLGASGSGAVTAIRTRSGDVSCDLIVVCGPLVPNAGMAAQAGARMVWRADPGAFVPEDLPAGVTVAGAAAGDVAHTGDHTPAGGKRSFVCLCSDVTSEDMRRAIAEGFDHIETLKRYTTATMGPCQGRMCQLSAAAVCARETGRGMGETGVTTSRPPNPGVTLGALAGPRHHPVRRTPMHEAHEALGAVWMDMGDWKRPRQYGPSIADEYRAVRERAGLIDVSTLGKLSVRGPDAGKLLDKVYTHRFSDLKPGRVRYALLCDESGVILDDGTISRLDGERYFITTTTGNLDFVHQWLDWHLIGTGWDVRITNVTAGYGAMNVAGPRARDLLAKLTGEDLSTAAFPYMSCRESDVAGAPSVLLRIGFVGETGWEIHTPAELAEGVWTRLLEAGREFGAAPFGVEAQRLLRLEKRHVIIGVDTDALTSPYEAGLGWAVRLDKEDFVGKRALTRAARNAGPERLVGFTLNGPGVPDDGSAVVLEGRIAGRVTSCRHSPHRQAAIGLAWVPAASAMEGARIQIRVQGVPIDATVTLQPFYDPEGSRLRQ